MKEIRESRQTFTILKQQLDEKYIALFEDKVILPFNQIDDNEQCVHMANLRFSGGEEKCDERTLS